MRRFAELSRGWGIGEETYEFWSRLARQYRIMGEVLELAQTQGFDVPPLPAPAYAPPPTPTPGLTVFVDDLPISSANPLHVLHPPAFYFYAAALCTLERRVRFDAAIATEHESGGVALSSAPGLVNEKKVDHGALVVELLTRTYDLLVAGGAAGSGIATFVALQAARTLGRAQQYEPAMR